MTPNEAGVALAAKELKHNWYSQLSASQLAAYIRYQFIRLYDGDHDWDSYAHNRRRAHWDGGKDSYGVKHTSVWSRIAAAVKRHNAHPGLWVNAHFSAMSFLRAGAQTTGLPEMRPTRLYSAQSYEIYIDYCEKLPKILANNFDVAGVTLAKRFRGTQDLKLAQDDQVFYVVCDELYVSASPFFRHAFSAQLGCERGVERYLWLAALDYESQQPAYDNAVEPWCVTDALRAAVINIREHWEAYK